MEIPELIPAADYNSKGAELKAGISWLLTKAYGRDIPQDCRQMFYEDDQDVEYIAPAIVEGLTGADIYCKACANIFREKVTIQGQGHQAVMQLLSRRGIYVTENGGSAVTESMLKQYNPVHLSGHMALVRALIKAHTQEVVTVERVVKAVRSFTTFSASSELPCDTEATVVLWINKACSVMRARLEQQNATRARVPQKQLPDLDKPGIPVIEDFMRDICDGCCLASLISFYCPDALRFQDVVTSESLNIADSLYNLQLVMMFAEQHLPLPCLCLSLNDLFHAPANLKPHSLGFVAELFRSFEVDPIKGVRRECAVHLGAGDVTNVTNVTAQPTEGSPSALRKFLPPGGISSATRRSFNNNAGVGGAGQVFASKSTPDRSSSSGAETRLLPRRVNQTKKALQNGETSINSSSPPKGPTGNPSHSVRAWTEADHSVHPREGSADRLGTPSRGRGAQNTRSQQQSQDSSAYLLANVSIDTSLDFSSDVSIDVGCDESMFVNSATSKPSVPARMQSDMELESVSSRASSGGATRRDSQKEALTPAKLKPAKEKSNTHTKETESGDIDSSPEEFSTPSAENVAFVDGIRTRVARPESQPNSAVASLQQSPGSSSTSRLRSTKNAQSFTVSNHRHTPESARAAGIPVLASHRRGSVGCERSSSDGSDQELQKIHADHRDHETKDSFYLHGSSTQVDDGARSEITRPTSLNVTGSRVGGRANPRASQVGEGDDAGDLSSSSMSLVEQFQRGRDAGTSPSVKKTTFAALPNQTTWQERALKSQQSIDESRGSGADDGDVTPLASELLSVRMRLVEQRRQIELGKRRAEMQRTKKREQLGKQAFIQVISKGNKGSTGGADEVVVAQQEDSTKQVDLTKQEDLTKQDDLTVADLASSCETGEVVSIRSSKQTAVSARQKQAASVVEPNNDKALSHDHESRDNIRLPQRNRVGDVEDKRAESTVQQPNGGTIDNSRTTPERQKPCHVPEPDEASRRHEPDYPALSMQSAALVHTSQENLQEYGTSLNKLNSSLTELQGEIMRLSLQQDRIKSVNVSPSTTQQRFNMAASPDQSDTVSSSSSSSQNYVLRPGLSGGEPDVAGGVPTGPMQQVASSFSQTGVITRATTMYGQVPMQYSHGYGTPPQYAHTPFPPQYVQGQMAMPVYPYPGGPPVYGQPPAVYQPLSTYPNMPPGQIAWHAAAPAPHMPPPVSMVTTSYQPERHMAQTYTVAAQNQHALLSPQRTARSEPPPPPLNFASTYVTHHGNSPGSPPRVPGTPPGVSSPLSVASLVGHGDGPCAQVPDQFNGSDRWSDNSTPRPFTAPPVDSPESKENLQKDGGFFITLDSASPQKHKPKLGSVKRKDAPSTPRQTSSSEQVTSPVEDQVPSRSSPSRTLPMTPTRTLPATPQQDAFRPEVSASPGVGFVIGQNDMSATDPNDLEKRRERFLEQQMRRREEQDHKRHLLESDSAKKKEVNRLKQEHSEQKKADEKTRRDAIFQQYLQKKAEAAEEGVAAPRRQPLPGNRTARLVSRPKSQPPGEDKASHSSSHSSQEELCLHGRSPVLDLKPAVPMTHSDPLHSGFTPPFGGFTQRWPATPGSDKTSRTGTDNLSDCGSNPSSLYSGPKLFVTPSQKSNRHIIVNAISHRCLAGTVNQEVKNRVLEVISQSEAKHFLILFRDGGLQYRGLYTYSPEREEVFKIQGVGPKQLNNKTIERFYKYNSGTKAFSEIASTKHLSATIDAVVLQNSMWQKKQAPRKPPAGQY